MLSIFANMFSVATHQKHWDAPTHWTPPRRRPITDWEARQIDNERRARVFKTLW